MYTWQTFIQFPALFVGFAIFLLAKQSPANADIIRLDGCNEETVNEEFCMAPFEDATICECFFYQNHNQYFCSPLSGEFETPDPHPHDLNREGRRYCYDLTCIPEEGNLGVRTQYGIPLQYCFLDGKSTCIQSENPECYAMEFRCSQNRSGQYYLDFQNICDSCCSGACCNGPCCEGTCCDNDQTCCAGECCKHECIDNECVRSEIDGDEETENSDDSGCSSSKGKPAILFSLIMLLLAARRRRILLGLPPIPHTWMP